MIEPANGTNLHKKCQPLKPESCSLLIETDMNGQVSPNIPTNHKNITEYNCIPKSPKMKQINGNTISIKKYILQNHQYSLLVAVPLKSAYLLKTQVLKLSIIVIILHFLS